MQIENAYYTLPLPAGADYGRMGQILRPSVVSNCDSFYYVKSSDSCENISTAQFLAWNPSAGSDCSGLWAHTHFCSSRHNDAWQRYRDPCSDTNWHCQQLRQLLHGAVRRHMRLDLLCEGYHFGSAHLVESSYRLNLWANTYAYVAVL
jgi:hypothetical protein